MDATRTRARHTDTHLLPVFQLDLFVYLSNHLTNNLIWMWILFYQSCRLVKGKASAKQRNVEQICQNGNSCRFFCQTIYMRNAVLRMKSFYANRWLGSGCRHLRINNKNTSSLKNWLLSSTDPRSLDYRSAVVKIAFTRMIIVKFLILTQIPVYLSK